MITAIEQATTYICQDTTTREILGRLEVYPNHDQGYRVALRTYNEHTRQTEWRLYDCIPDALAALENLRP